MSELLEAAKIGSEPSVMDNVKARKIPERRIWIENLLKALYWLAAMEEM
jgi:hypothetical protein